MGMALVRTGQWQPGGTSAVELEGYQHGSAVTLIVEDMPPGGGPRLHQHPYGEVWVVIAGRAAFTDGNETVEAGTGDVMYVGAGTPHKFTSIGDVPLKMVCIHENERFATEWLEPKEPAQAPQDRPPPAPGGQLPLNSSTPQRPMAPTKIRQ